MQVLAIKLTKWVEISLFRSNQRLVPALLHRIESFQGARGEIEINVSAMEGICVAKMKIYIAVA
ncbi:hypothetical protein BK653_17795 [Pseudomonas brassicacearum]|nr:hypothetical protein BK653_17795 [Pseudomonas brassicacearum]